MKKDSIKKLNTTTDALVYLTTGCLTEPFIDNDVLHAKVIKDMKAHIKFGERYTVVDSLVNYIHKYIKTSTSKKFNAKNKFNRTAQEIWESGLATGCTDYALLFCTFARQLNLPTTFVSTIGEDYYLQAKYGKSLKMHKGHAFCECCVKVLDDSGKAKRQWVLVDPTCHKLTANYLKDNIFKINFDVNGNSKFIPFFRGLDLGERTNSNNWNQKMDDYISNN